MKLWESFVLSKSLLLKMKFLLQDGSFLWLWSEIPVLTGISHEIFGYSKRNSKESNSSRFKSSLVACSEIHITTYLSSDWRKYIGKPRLLFYTFLRIVKLAASNISGSKHKKTKKKLFQFLYRYCKIKLLLEDGSHVVLKRKISRVIFGYCKKNSVTSHSSRFKSSLSL